MTSYSHDSIPIGRERPPWAEFLRIRELWASLAISTMWLAVAVDALWGPDFVSSSGGGSTTIPSAVFVAFFAWLATISVARYGLRRDKD